MISVIVPVYNVAEYVGRCVRSLLEQTFLDLEYIFVDDCSTDDSVAEIEKVLDTFPHRRPNVRIIRMEANCGVSAARNRGLEEAQGELVGFCDSDDWIDPDMYESLYNAFREYNADVVLSDFYLEKQEGTRYYHAARNQGNRVRFLKEYLRSQWTPVYNMLVDKKLLTSNNLLFPVGISLCEDLNFTARVLYYSENPVNVDRAFYHYDMSRDTSAIHDVCDKKSQDQLKSFLDLISFFREKGIEKDIRREMSWRVLVNKRHLIYDISRHKEFISIYPESAGYIFSCPWLKIKMELLMWALTHHLRFITKTVIFVSNRINQIG